MNRQYHVVVAGAGVAGLALALGLDRQKPGERLRITLADRQAPAEPEADYGLRVSALSYGSLEYLNSIGIDAVDDFAGPYRDMRVWDAAANADGAGTLHFSAAEFALPQLGHIVDDARLRYQLLQQLQASDVDLRLTAGMASVTQDSAVQRVHFDDGTELEADLLIGADGGASFVREASGIEARGWKYQQSAFVTHAACELIHAETAWQRFLKDGPIALLPLADGRVSIVWSTTPETANAMCEAEENVVSAALTTASDGVLGELRVAGPRVAFPLQAKHATNYVKRQVALIGDAAHVVHPLAGQGANLGLADAEVLTDVLLAALRSGETPGDLPVLRRYERRRRGANASMLQLIDSLQKLFGSENALLADLRSAGMLVFNQSGPLKMAAMRVALGLDRQSQS